MAKFYKAVLKIIPAIFLFFQGLSENIQK